MQNSKTTNNEKIKTSPSGGRGARIFDPDRWYEIWQAITHNKSRSVLTAFGIFSQGNIEIFGKAVYIQFLCADDELGDCRCCTVLSVLVFDG